MEQCEGQINLTDLLKSKVISRKVMDLTTWINSQGDAQYDQIKKLIRDRCEHFGIKADAEQIDRLTNSVSVYVLEQSMGYMYYLAKESTI